MQARAALMTLVLAALGAIPLESARALRDRIEIRRDRFGVPHILAEDIEAAGYGFGYAMAEDHGAELGRRYLQARGEAAGARGLLGPRAPAAPVLCRRVRRGRPG